MKGNATYKIPDGKLVKVTLDFEGEKILGISIFGDFFLYPEEGIVKIEGNLAGIKLSEQELIQCINKTVHESNLELFGLSAEGLTKAILMAKEGALK